MDRVIVSGRPVSEIVRELDVHENLLHEWVREERHRMAAAGQSGGRGPDSGGEQLLSAEERAELVGCERKSPKRQKISRS
ncbi:transposase [Nocardia sp. NPDC059091]|uniref:transposase n=1 Tax=Nocardia sp. NPDC059091 TaxID=3346724 RepID=UPI0036A6338F